MRRLVVVLTALLFAACGDSPTGAGGVEIPDGPLSLTLIQGDDQQVAITDTLPSDVVVQITKGGEPLPNQLVDWVVLRDNCGSPFVTTTRTDNDGQTGNRLVAGTLAWTLPDGPDVCQMEIRYALVVSDTVQARVDTTVSYRVNPGPFATLPEAGAGWGDTGRELGWWPVAEDAHGNPADQYLVISAKDSVVIKVDSRESPPDTTWAYNSRDVLTVVDGHESGLDSMVVREKSPVDSTRYAVVCHYAVTPGADTLGAVALATTGANMGIMMDTYWGHYQGTPSSYGDGLLGPEDCERL